MRIVVDRQKCSGLGMCEAEAPELFEVTDDGSLRVLRERPGPGSRAELEAAVASCPTEALQIVDD